MSAYPVNLTDEDDGTVVVTSPDFLETNAAAAVPMPALGPVGELLRADDLRSGSGRTVGACGEDIRGGDRVCLARSDGRSGAAAPGG